MVSPCGIVSGYEELVHTTLYYYILSIENMSMLLTGAFADNYETVDEHLAQIHAQFFCSLLVISS